MEADCRQAIFQNSKLQSSFELNGYVKIKLLSPDELAKLRETYQQEQFDSPSGFYSTSFSEDEEAKAQLEKAIDSIVKEKAEKLFHPHKPLGSCYLSKAPGIQGEMPIHQDWTVIDESKFDSITMWIPLVDVNHHNGALQVIPGSHRFSDVLRSPSLDNPLSDIEEKLREDLITIPLEAGEALVFSQALIHASPANQSSDARLAITYGLIPEEAKLLFYHGEDNSIEQYEVPIEFFKGYNTKIGQRPDTGTCIRKFENKQIKLDPKSYRVAKTAFNLKKSSMYKMIPIFKKPEHQQFFEEEGYLVLPLLNKDEVKDLSDYYKDLQLVDSQGFGFHVSMDDLSQEDNIKVRKKIWDMILPNMDAHLENYKPFVASFVVKESNPKGVVPAHQDWSFVDKEEDGYCSITCWTALVDTELDNGCMGVIKKSHKLMQNPRPSPSPQTPVPLSEHMFSIFPYLTTLHMKAGEVLFFDNRTFHASPPNTTAEIRLAAGVGITQKDAKLVHYHLKADDSQSTLEKYAIDEDFFLKYNNAKLAKLYDAKEKIEGYDLLEEIPYTYDKYTSEELVELIKAGGNEFNVPMCEKLSGLFGYDMTGQKKETEDMKKETTSQEEIIETPTEKKKSFFQVYTPINILKEIKYRLTGK